MAAEHEFIKALLTGGPGSLAPEGQPHAWSTIAAAMDAVTSAPSDETLELLGEVLRHTARIDVLAGAECPHLFTPREALQLQAIQALAGWRPLHEGLTLQIDSLIEEFAEATDSDILEELARHLLTPPSGGPQ